MQSGKDSQRQICMNFIMYTGPVYSCDIDVKSSMVCQ